MSALVRCGWEGRGTVIEMGNAAENKGAPTIDTTNQRKVKVGGVEYGGAACVKFSNTGTEQGCHAPGLYAGLGAFETWTYHRVCFKKVGTTGGTRVIARFYTAEGKVMGAVEVTNANKLLLKNGAAATVAEVTNGLDEAGMTGQGGYHVIEFAVWIHATVATTCKARWWVDGVEVHKNESTWTVETAAKKPEGMRIGWLTGESTATLYADDIGVNDSAGSKNNERLGTGTVLGHMVPTADKGREGITTGAGGTTELYKAVDAPPEGVADGSKTATSQIYSATSSTTHFYEATLGTYTALGVGASDVLKCLRAISFKANSSATTRSAGVSGISNPVITETTASTLGTAAAFPSGWNMSATGFDNEPSVTRGTGPVIKVRKNVLSTDALAWCYMALQVEWEPVEGAATVEGKATAKGVGTLVAAGTVSGAAATESEIETVELASVGKPKSYEEHALKFSAQKLTAGSTVKVKAKLYDEATLIYEGETAAITTALVAYELAISKASAEKIVHYGHLSIQFFWVSSDGYAGEVFLSEIGLALPESEAVPETITGKATLKGTGTLVAAGSVAGVPSTVEGKATIAGKGTLTARALGVVPVFVQGITLVSELPSDQLAISVSAPGGVLYRWADDEPNAENVVSQIAFQSAMPGGYTEAHVVLAREPERDWRDLVPYGEVSIYGPGVEKVWEGSLDKGPKVSGFEPSISPGFVGWQYTLEDDQAVQVGFIDSDISKWSGEKSTSRREVLRNANWVNVGSVSTGRTSTLASSPSSPAVTIDMEFGFYSATVFTIGNEAIYDSGGVDLGRIMYDYVQLTAWGEEAIWGSSAALAIDDAISAWLPGKDHNRTPTPQLAQTAPEGGGIAAAGYTYALVIDYRAADGVNSAT